MGQTVTHKFYRKSGKFYERNQIGDDITTITLDITDTNSILNYDQ